MKAACRAALKALERLSHHEVLDIPDTHSREGPGDGRATVWHFKNGLAARRLRHYRAIHWEALTAMREALEPAAGAAALALRGRLKRLLGDEPGARLDLKASWAQEPGAWAAGWLGEMDVFIDPRRALEILERARALDERWPWPHLWKAAALLALKKTAAAEKELSFFTEKRGSPSFIARLLYFQLRMMQGDFRLAHEEARAAIRLDSASPAGYDAAGKALHALGRPAEALRRFHDARERDPDVAGTYVFEGINLDLTWEAPRVYLANLDAAIRKRPRQAVLYAERAELKRDPHLCLYQEALQDYATAVKLEPRRGWLRAVLGRAKNNLHGGQAGLEDFDRAARLAPRCGWIRAWRGALLARLGRGGPALADFRAAERLMPWYPFTYSWRGALFNRMGKFLEARRDLDLAIRLDPNYMFSFYERFRALRGLKEDAAAVADLNRCFAADPKYTWFGPALKPGEKEAALRDLEDALKRLPGSAWLWAWRGCCHLELGDPRAALSALEQALILEKNSGLIFAWRGRAWRELGRLERAAADLRKAVRLAPALWTAHHALAEIREAQGRLKEALGCWSEVTRLAPTTVPYLLAKARLALRLNRRREALRDVNRALQLDPGLFSQEERRAVSELLGSRYA